MPPTPARFLLVLLRAFAPAGGLESYNRLLIRAFAELARERGGEWRALILSDSQEMVAHACLSEDARCIQAFGGAKGRFAAAGLASIVQFHPDLVVFGHVHFGALLLPLRVLRPRVPFWVATYGVDVWRRLSLLRRLGLKRADRVLAISDDTRRVVSSLNGVDPQRVNLLPCAVDPIWSSLAGTQGAEDRRRERPLVLTVARLSWTDRQKGVEHALRALALVLRTLPDVRYVIVGDGDDRGRLQDLARQVAVDHAVEFRGWLPVRELAEAYQESELFLMPSLMEGFGMVFLEAALFAKPSVAARAGGAPDAVEDNVTGRLVSGRDVAETAAVVCELLLDPKRLREMGERARRRCLDRFSYQTFRATLARYVDTGEPARAVGA
jgi:glycosyltransferase involved in cell wall biosynthesis